MSNPQPWEQVIEQRFRRATDVGVPAAKAARYEHGGGRLFIDAPAGESRTLVLDAYNEADREFYFHAHGDVARLLVEHTADQAEIARLRQEMDRAQRRLVEHLRDHRDAGVVWDAADILQRALASSSSASQE